VVLTGTRYNINQKKQNKSRNDKYRPMLCRDAKKPEETRGNYEKERFRIETQPTMTHPYRLLAANGP
jgi:hypothetical protein